LNHSKHNGEPNLIRPATAADIPGLMNLERACVTAGHWTEEQYRRIVHPGEGDPQRLVIVAEALPQKTLGMDPPGSSAVSGFLVALQLGMEWELENIVVAPAERRRGLGQQLLEVLISTARSTNSEAVFLEVRESNAAARSLYEKAGFELIGRRKAYYANPPEDAVLYRAPA
jgi:[ribosomal protein S18]-alanine N-acetyltransferase